MVEEEEEDVDNDCGSGARFGGGEQGNLRPDRYSLIALSHETVGGR